MRYEIQDWMTRTPLTISTHAMLEEAWAVMDRFEVRHLPVVEGTHLVGIISDRDILRFWAEKKREQVTPKVGDAMSADPYAVDAHSNLSKVLKIMGKNRLGCVVIKSQGDHIAGIFTATDALLALSKVTSH